MNTIIQTNVHKLIKITSDVSSPKFGEFSLIEIYENEKVINQVFKPKVPFHNGYQPDKMEFLYYGKKIDIVEDFENLNEYKLKPVIIHNIYLFEDFDHLCCNYIPMDGNVYLLTSPWALPLKKTIEVWRSECNLEKAKEHLVKFENVSNIVIENTPHYNRGLCGWDVLSFDITPDQQLIEELSTMRSVDEKYYIHEKLGLTVFKNEKRY